MKKKDKIIIWAYLVEIVAASLLTVLIYLIWSGDLIADFITGTAISLATIFGLLFTVAAALLGILYSQVNSEFGKWLDWKGAYLKYLSALIATIVIFIITTTLLLILNKINYSMIIPITIWFCLLGLIAAISLFKNIYELIKLNLLFNREFAKENNNN